MRKLLFLFVLGLILVVNGTAAAITLQFDPMDIFNYATSDDTRLNQQGTARYIQTTGVTGRYYQTYNDDVDTYQALSFHKQGAYTCGNCHHLGSYNYPPCHASFQSESGKDIGQG